MRVNSTGTDKEEKARRKEYYDLHREQIQFKEVENEG